MADVLAFQAKANDGATIALSTMRGQVLLIVNTASACGFTPQYTGLQALQDRFGPRGFSVLGFPCNQFGGQEPGDDRAIATFCERRKVSFPIFAKVDVNGPDAHPLWRALKAAKPGLLGLEAVKWNFTKFLIDRQGVVVERFAPATEPKAIAAKIEALL